MFEHSCVASVCENNQPVIVKIHPLIFVSKKIINSLSEWAVSDSACVQVTEGKKSRPFVMLPYRHSPEWEAAVRLHNWLLAVAAGYIYL